MKNRGVVERIYAIIRKDLLFYYLENPTNFDIKNSLNLVMKKYNNLIHKSTKHTSFEIFY